MHEMALAESMLEIVEKTARMNGAVKVSAVRLEIGALSHVACESLRFCFDVVTRGSLAEGAALEIESVPGEAWCMPCGTRVPLGQCGDPCPHCGSHQLEVTRGDDMRIKDIEIQQPSAAAA
jgi:hydrogenase nickel incorporation protein HypA/HybF